MPVSYKNQYLKEIAPVLYIQSDCDTPMGRDYLVQELSKFVRIDSYGNCLKNKSFPEEYVRNCIILLIKAIIHYLF